ncbi:MAG: hypothetical protein HY287_15940 [Planctomycetes bacterium]|nr:hypothetical protein [Planctomycetota bacterium]
MSGKSQSIHLSRLLFVILLISGCGVWVPAPGVEPPVDGGTGGGTPRAVLSASNTTPVENQSVTLTCRVQNSTSQVTRYDFNPTTGLVINHGGGTASFIVKQTDLGTTLRFTCSATLTTGAQLTSDSIAITPTGTPTSP